MTASAETAVARAGVDERSVVLVMTHNLAHDGRILRDLLPLAPRYLGLLGPRARGERLLAEVAHERGLSPEKCMSLARFPIGLDLGGDGPAAIALSALAEAQALIHGRTGGFLKDRIGSIHNPNAR